MPMPHTHALVGSSDWTQWTKLIIIRRIRRIRIIKKSNEVGREMCWKFLGGAGGQVDMTKIYHIHVRNFQRKNTTSKKKVGIHFCKVSKVPNPSIMTEIRVISLGGS